jgi:hypothetical protein
MLGCSCSLRSIDDLRDVQHSNIGVAAAGGTEHTAGNGAQAGSFASGGAPATRGGSAGAAVDSGGTDGGSDGTPTDGGAPPVGGEDGGRGATPAAAGTDATGGSAGSSDGEPTAGTSGGPGAGAGGAPGAAGAPGGAGGTPGGPNGGAGPTDPGCMPGDPCPLSHETSYRLVPGHNPDGCIDVRGRSVDEGALVQQYANRGQSNQTFWAEARGNGRFSFRSAQSAKCLEVSDASIEAGAFIRQRACTGAAHQLWRPIPLPDGLFRLVADHSGLVLDVEGAASLLDSERVVQNPARDVPDSTWQLRETDRGAFVALRGSETSDLRVRHAGRDVTFDDGNGSDEWKVVSGLADVKCVSFESRDEPGRFLRNENGVVTCEPWNQSAEFAADATFCLWQSLEDLGWSYASIEPFSSPGEYLLHDGDQVVTAPFADTEAFYEAATWFIREP